MIKIEKIHGTLLLIGEEECRRARLDIDQRVRNAVAEWKSTERWIKIDRRYKYGI